MEGFSFEVLREDKQSRARTGIIHTRHGDIKTPYLIPVATKGYVRALSSQDLATLGIQAALANTYHLHINPGDEEVKAKGGLQELMKFHKPTFTDSGGFQVFSLGLRGMHRVGKIGMFTGRYNSTSGKGENHAKITEEGVQFTDPKTGKVYFFSPKSSMQMQSNIGADVIMAFDECTSPLMDEAYIRESMERSHRWEVLSLYHKDRGQALYGIVHGGWFRDQREESAKFISSLPFQGIAIGGSLGKTKKDMLDILDWVVPLLDKRPRHLLGIGYIPDIFESVERGIDTFDCVHMTRVARHGGLFCRKRNNPEGRDTLTIKKPVYENDQSPIDPECHCPVCTQGVSRAEMRELYKKVQSLEDKAEYDRPATMHNVYFMEDLMSQVRESINNGKFSELKREWIN